MLLVKFSDNWADEIDIEGCVIMSEEEYEKYLNAAKRAFEIEGSISFYIGSNEEIRYGNFEDFKKTLKIRTLQGNDETVLRSYHFDNYGIFPDYIFDEYYNEEK